MFFKAIVRVSYQNAHIEKRLLTNMYKSNQT